MAFNLDIATVTRKEARLPKCGACGLFRRCPGNRLPVQGAGHKSILVVTDAPSRASAEHGSFFDQECGRRLARELSSYQINLKRDCWITGALVCSTDSGAEPGADQVDHCRPNLRTLMAQLRPSRVLLLGHSAIASFIQSDWKGDANPQTSTWVGETIPSQKFNAWVVPCYHPRQLDDRNADVMALHFRDALARLAACPGRPWRGAAAPVYQDLVEPLFEPDVAAEAIAGFARSPVVAFDYETNMLKPEGHDAQIVSVAFSDGHRTIAAPWFPAVREATREVLRSPNGKIASNLKFEQRWSIAEFGHGVRNWVWDTMQAAHWISQRPSITSVKFQAYALLGQPDYDGHLKHLLDAEYATRPNRIGEIAVRDLLVYNGMDALLEFLVAIEQVRHTDYPLPFKETFDDIRPIRAI